MKYSAIVLACVLAIAAAVDYNNGQYIPEKQYNNRYNQYKPSRYQPYQNNAYKPFVSSTPLPSLYVSSTPVPVTAAPARSTVYYTSSTPKPVFNIPALPSRSLFVEAAKPAVASALPSRSLFVEPAKPAVVSALPARSVLPARASVQTPSWSSRASWPSAKAQLPVAPTQASLSASASVDKIEAPVVSVVPAARLAPVVQVAPVAPVISVTPVAPVAPVYAQAKIALPAARWAGDAGAAETLKYSNQINNDGDFQYSYETNNGIYAQESGSHRSFYNGEEQVAPVVAQGSFGWTSPEGQQIAMTYVADELGYRPTGPQVHPQLARALEYLAARNLQVSH